MATQPITLDFIREAAEAKYGALPIDLGDGKVVKLLNPLRMPKERRERLVALQNDMDAEGSDTGALLEEALTLAAETEGGAKLLIDAIGGDLAVLAATFEQYGKGVQVGEASASDD